MNKDGNNAPEVVEGNGADGLIPAHDPMAEQGKSIPQYPSYAQSPPHFQEDQSYSSAYGSRDEKLAGGASTEAIYKEPQAGKRKRLIWIIIGAILLALAIGLGVGLGVGLSQKSSKTTENVSNGGISEGASASTTSSSSIASTTATATSSAVTSGSTGLAEFSCNSTETTTSQSGTPYIQECFTQYQVGHPSYYADTDNVTMSNLGGKITVYTFQDCLDKCDERNAAGTTPACRAVTYYANLTAPIQAWGGNCFLKNDRGNGYQTDKVDYSHTASAYQSCLNATCSAANA